MSKRLPGPRTRLMLTIGVCALATSCATTPPASLKTEDVLAAALPGVALIVTEARGTIQYGAGVWLSPTRLLTNLHVVGDAQRIAVLPWDNARPLYTPLDGGLSRVLFENRAALRAAGVLRVDPTVDLAVLELEAPWPSAVVLPLREAPVRPGERVYALGHPKEALWSFTAGVVSATPVDAIQHDAPVNQGNSGGALIDEQGRLAGVNTFKIVGGAESMSFARPVKLGLVLARDEVRRAPVDRSTPERAFETCSRAIELRSEDAADCVLVRFAAVGQSSSRPSRRTLELMRQRYPEQFDAVALERTVRASLKTALGRRAQPSWSHLPKDSFLRRVVEQKDAREPFVTIFSSRNIKGFDLVDRFASHARLVKLGQRVVERHDVSATEVWLRIEGRNADNTTYTYSQLFVKDATGWASPESAAPDELARRPVSWPIELFDLETIRRAYEQQNEAIARQMPIRPALGIVAAIDLTSSDSALTVAGLHSASPAARAGLKVGDKITAVNGVATPDPRRVAAALSTFMPGGEVTLDTGRSRLTARVVGLSELPLVELDATLAWDLDDELGVEVLQAPAGSPLEPGDVITAVNRRRVVNLVDLAVELLTQPRKVEVEVQRGAPKRTVKLLVLTRPVTPGVWEMMF